MMDDKELVKIIQGHINDGIGSDRGSVSELRKDIVDRYHGEAYGDEVDGESKVTTREIMETIEWALPPLLRHFTAGDMPVVFEPEGQDDEEAAEQETEAVTQQFWKDNHGFTILYLMLKTVLMNPNGYVKVYREERERVVFEHYRGLDLEDIAMIEDDDELEMIEASDPDEDTGFYSAKVKRRLKKGRNLVQVLPEDEVVVDASWSDLDLDECPFIAHSPELTHSDLLEMGYDEEDLDEAYSGGDAYNSEETNRETTSDEGNDNDESHKALRKYRYHECSMLVDWDDDGIAERRRVAMIGHKIFDNEEDNEVTIISAATILMPHRHVGVSMAETLMDLQEIKTVVTRQLLTNMYRANNPRTIALKGANISDILANRANGVLRAKAQGDITMEQTAPIIGQVIPLLDLLDQTKEQRSGISKQSTVPDPDMLKNSAEGSFLAMVEKADQRIDLLARLFAETIVKRIYIKLHALIQRHGDTKDMKLAGEWVRVDPTSWRRRESMTVKIGLGRSSKGQQLAAATMITTDHNQIIEQGGVADPNTGKPGLITMKHVYNGRKLMVKALGEFDVDRYYMNPDMLPPPPPQQPQPDVNLLMIQSNERIEQGKGQIKIMELQQEQRLAMIKTQTDMALEEREARFKQLETGYEMQMAQMKQQIASTAATDKAENDRLRIELAGMEAQLKDAQNEEKLAVDKYKADLSAETDILIERMRQGYDVDGQGTVAALTSGQEEFNATLGQMAQMIQELRQPKEIAYDADGEIVGVSNPLTGEIRPLRRGPNGEPIGLA